MQNITSTDLHMQFKQETGEHFQWDSWNDKKYNSTSAYKVAYGNWIEEKYLELINKETHI